MTLLSFYLTVAGRSPQRHATFRNGMRLFLRTTPYYKVLKSNSLCCKVLQSTTLRYKVLVQYCKVLFHTTKYYSCTTLYYNVLLQYIILCTTKYYSILQSTTLYYKELLRATKYCSILLCEPGHIWDVIYNARNNRSNNPASPNSAPAKKNNFHDWSWSHMKRSLQFVEQQTSPSNLTKYCTCHQKKLTWSIRVTHETLFTMRGATDVTLQPH